MKIIKTQVLTVVILLIYLSVSVRKQTNAASLPLIADLYFQNGEILFVAADGLSFGHINKNNGTIPLKYRLELLQKILTATPHQILVSGGSQMTQYETFGRQSLRISSPFSQMTGQSNASRHVGFQVFPFGQYICMGQSLYLTSYSTNSTEPSIPILLTLSTDQKLLSLHTFDSILLLLSITPAELCFTQIDYTMIRIKKCITRVDVNVQPQIVVSGKFVYVEYTNTNTGMNLQVLDHDFTVIQSFQQPVLQYFKGMASFAGWRTYDATSRSIKNWKLVAHNTIGQNTLAFDSGEYILKQGNQIIVKVPNISSEPHGIWLNKNQVYIGKVQGRYQLLIQFSTGSANFYQILADQGQTPSITLKWSI